MSKVKILIACAMTAIASGASVGSFAVALTDSNGASQYATVDAASFPAPAADGTFQVEVDFDNVGSGSFSGVVQARDQGANVVGSPVSFSGTATNMQPMPVSVAVAFA